MKLAGGKVMHNNKINTKKWLNLAPTEKRSLFTAKKHGGNISALACFPFEKRSFPDTTLQATWLDLDRWGESRVSTSSWLFVPSWGHKLDCSSLGHPKLLNGEILRSPQIKVPKLNSAEQQPQKKHYHCHQHEHKQQHGRPGQASGRGWDGLQHCFIQEKDFAQSQQGRERR